MMFQQAEAKGIWNETYNSSSSRASLWFPKTIRRSMSSWNIDSRFSVVSAFSSRDIDIVNHLHLPDAAALVHAEVQPYAYAHSSLNLSS